MGFTPKRKLFELEWPADHELHGFQVTMERLPVDEFMKLLTATGGGASVDPAELDHIYKIVGTRIVEWNLEVPKGTPVTPSVEALKREDVTILLEIIAGWMGTIATVSAPLEEPSTAGGPSVELMTIPVDVLSSLPS